MNKLLPFALLLVIICAHAQTAPPPGNLPATEILKYQHQHDSMQVLISKRRKEVGAYNRAHPIKKRVVKPAKR